MFHRKTYKNKEIKKLFKSKTQRMKGVLLLKFCKSYIDNKVKKKKRKQKIRTARTNIR